MRKPRVKGRARPGGWAEPGQLPKGPNGRALCRYCGTEVTPPRRTFCSGERARWYRGKEMRAGHGCVHEHCIRSDPGYARDCVKARDGGKCAICGTVDIYWEMDHIIPVVEGGGDCGLENLRTLCVPCHRRETAALAKRRAEARRANPGVRSKQ